MNQKKTDIQAKRAQFEQEKLTRRAALRKFGLTTGMSVFGLLAVDDLARVVVAKMQEHEATKAIADGLAREFKDAGAVFAVVGTTCATCSCCLSEKQRGRDVCQSSLDACIRGGGTVSLCDYSWQQCNSGVDGTYYQCCVANGCNC